MASHVNECETVYQGPGQFHAAVVVEQPMIDESLCAFEPGVEECSLQQSVVAPSLGDGVAYTCVIPEITLTATAELVEHHLAIGDQEGVNAKSAPCQDEESPSVNSNAITTGLSRPISLSSYRKPEKDSSKQLETAGSSKPSQPSNKRDKHQGKEVTQLGQHPSANKTAASKRPTNSPMTRKTTQSGCADTQQKREASYAKHDSLGPKTAAPKSAMAAASGRQQDAIGENDMRSSSVRPVNRQNSGTQRSNGRASTSAKGGSSRTPSVPPVSGRLVNKKYANAKSRIDTVSDYNPQQSSVRIFDQPVRFKNVGSKVGSLQNASHVPGGGALKIESHKLHYKEGAKPKIEDRATIEIPRSVKKIESQKLNWNAASKVGSMDNATHKPAGGSVKIFDQPVKFASISSKVGSMDNASHRAGGGNLKIADYKVPTPRSVTHQNGTSSRSSLDQDLSSTNMIRN